MISLISRSWAAFAYELMRETVRVSTPDSTRSRTMPATCSRSTGSTGSPCALMRSFASRVSSSAAGGSGFTMMIQPASGPGVWERARWRICPKPCVVTSPTRAPFASSIAFVATVVPCMTKPRSPGSILLSSQMRRTPTRTPSDGSAGVEGVFTRKRSPFSSSTRSKSVKVPPTSTPSLCAMPLLSAGERRERPRAVDVSLERALQHALEPFGDADQRLQVDPGLDALAVEDVDEALGPDVPGRPRGEGASADASDGCVEHRGSSLERGERVRVAGVAGVVQVGSDRRPRKARAADEVPARRGNRDADRVGEDALVDRRREPLGEVDHVPGVDRALERAAEGDADRDGDADAVRPRALGDALGGGHRLLDGGVLVPPVEGLGRGEGEVHLVQPGGGQPVVAPLVERESGVDDAVAALESLDDLLGAGHLRHPLGVHEADRLDAAEASLREPVHELCAHRRLQGLRLVLEAVARPYVADGHAHSTPSSRRSASASPDKPSSPPKTSSLWLPCSHVADQRTSPGVSENFGTIPGPMYAPNSGSSCSRSMSRARKCSSAKMSAIV